MTTATNNTNAETTADTSSGPSTSSGDLREFDPHTVKRMLDAGEARLVDVREPDEHRRERIPGAELHPGSSLDPQKLRPIDGTLTILHCRTGNRSREAAGRLMSAGHDKLAHLAGGLEAWKQAGLQVAVDRSAPIPIMRQVQIAVGILVLLSVISAVFWSTWALLLAGFVACGLIFAGVTGTCGMAKMLAIMPWNRNA